MIGYITEVTNRKASKVRKDVNKFFRREENLLARARKARRQHKYGTARKYISLARRIRTKYSGMIRSYRQQLLTDPYSYVELHRR